MSINNVTPASSVFSTYTNTSPITQNTVLAGPILNSSYATFTLTMTAITSGAIAVQVSNDNTTWVSLPGYDPTSTLWRSVTTISAVRTANFSVAGYQYVRIICTTAITSGTTTFTYGFSSVVANPQYIYSRSMTVNQDETQGYTPYQYLLNSASVTAPTFTTIKATRASLGFISVSNASNNQAYLHLVNAATGTVGSIDSTNVYAIPPISSTSTGTAHYLFAPIGLNYSTALSFYVSSGLAIRDAGSVAANTPITINIGYI